MVAYDIDTVILLAIQPHFFFDQNAALLLYIAIRRSEGYKLTIEEKEGWEK